MGKSLEQVTKPVNGGDYAVFEFILKIFPENEDVVFFEDEKFFERKKDIFLFHGFRVGNFLRLKENCADITKFYYKFLDLELHGFFNSIKFFRPLGIFGKVFQLFCLEIFSPNIIDFIKETDFFIEFNCFFIIPEIP